MRSFRELFVQQSALAIFTAANEREEVKGKGGHRVQKVDRERGKKGKRERERESVRGREMEKENRMEIRLGRYDEDNKSNHPAVSAHFAALPARSLPA